MYVRRCVAFATLLIIALSVAPARSATGSLTVYFDSGFTKTQLNDLEPGSAVAFYVVAENVAPEGLDGFSFGVEVDAGTVFLGLTPAAGAAVLTEPLEAGGTRYDVFAADGSCLTPDAGGRITLAEGILMWMEPGPDGETIVDLSGAVRLDATQVAPTWTACGRSNDNDFGAVVDGRIGPSGGPECKLTATVVDFGNVAAGNVVRRTVSISNQGGGQLEGSVAPGCGQVTVTTGAGPFALAFGQSRPIELELDATTPGDLACVIATGTGCSDIIVIARVIDPANIGEPLGAISVYLDASLTTRVAVNQVFGTSHTVYVAAEDLPAGATVRGYEAALLPGDFLPTQTIFNPPGSSVLAAGGPSDFIVDRNSCPALDGAGRTVLFSLSGVMLAPGDDYTATIAATGSASSALALGDAPLWEDCSGIFHPFAEVRAARIEYIDPNTCVRGPEVVDFGRVFTGDPPGTRTQTFTLTNAGTEPVAGTLGVDCSAFTIVAGADYDLAPHESHDVTVRFAPLGAGEYGCALSGGPMCSSVLLAGRGSTPRTVGAPEGIVGVYFDDAFTTTELTPDIGLFATMYVVADEFAAPVDGIDGFELALQLPGDMIVTGGTPFPHNVRYHGDGTQTLTLLVDVSSCRSADAQGRVVLCELQYLYLPLFPSGTPAVISPLPVDDSLFDPPTAGWTGCGGDAHPFAVLQSAVVHPWTAPAPAAPQAFIRNTSGTAVSLSWSPQADAAGYRLFRGDTPDFRAGRATLVAEITGTRYAEIVPDPSRYYYKLSAVDAGGVGSLAVPSDNTVAVAITAFDARATARGVELEWDIFADEDFAGFRIYRERDGGLVTTIHDALPVHERRFTDSDIAPGASYTYTLAAVRRGGEEVFSPSARVTITSARTALLGNFPNPFNPSTTVAFSLAEAARVRVSVFDAAGRLVATLADGSFPAGTTHLEWDGRNRAGMPSASGVYFVRFDAPGAHQTRKITLLK